MGRVEENKQQKQTSLMDTAFQLFTSQGLTKTSISDIVERAGVAKGTFYLYFKDKYDLHERLIVHRAEQIFQHAMENSGYEALESREDKLLAITDDILLQLQNNPTLLRFLNKNISWTVFHKVFEKAQDGYSDFFDELRHASPSRQKQMEIELFTVIELVGATSYSVILNGEPVSLEEYLPYLHDSIRAIMAGFDSHTSCQSECKTAEPQQGSAIL